MILCEFEIDLYCNHNQNVLAEITNRKVIHVMTLKRPLHVALTSNTTAVLVNDI